MNLRLSQKLRDRLECSARQTGRDLSEEIRIRLGASFDAIEFAVPETKALAQAVALALENEKKRTGFHWFQNAWAFSRSEAAIDQVLTLFQPLGDPTLVPEDAQEIDRLRSSGLEALIPSALEQLKDASFGEISGKWAVAYIEAAGKGKGSPELDYLRPISGVVKTLLRNAGNEAVAIKAIAAPIKARLESNHDED